MMLLLPVGLLAEDDATVTASVPMVRQTNGTALYDIVLHEKQATRNNLAIGVEYRHWFKHFGLEISASRVNTESKFTCGAAVTAFSVHRYEISGVILRRIRRLEGSRIKPFIGAGTGVMLFNGSLSAGWAHSVEGVLTSGMDIPITRRVSLKAATRYHLFMNTGFGDAHYKPTLAHAVEPTIGISFKF
jgi:hypothetical protein